MQLGNLWTPLSVLETFWYSLSLSLNVCRQEIESSFLKRHKTHSACAMRSASRMCSSVTGVFIMPFFSLENCTKAGKRYILCRRECGSNKKGALETAGNALAQWQDGESCIMIIFFFLECVIPRYRQKGICKAISRCQTLLLFKIRVLWIENSARRLKLVSYESAKNDERRAAWKAPDAAC